MLSNIGLHIEHQPEAVYTGFSAQNLRDVIPGSTVECSYPGNASGEAPDGTYLGLNPIALESVLAMTVREVKQLSANLSSAVNEIEQLKSKVKNLEDQLNSGS